ncbi:permease [Geodermatophilus sp. Leaf369]|uniref:sulfite exporter TauE/SafE family protein n=1 Tax=Geodermatophilus sp. Leaf369 TaxID=1736354 RepID=UPI0006F847A5|nr:sulfite exporter TauE/SafE family protein [Geodermatophilus sp. Leaf369]KQS60134.1 permease [Geodermatophilus sp. Leaf369]
MRTLILFALVGLGAQLVDGSLGMAYGVTSTTLLLAVGASPAAASATVHLAEIGTTLVSGASHWKFGNVDWRVVAKIGIPGGVGAFAGATFLSSLDTSVAAPLMSGILLVLGLYVLIRFTFRGLNKQNLGKPMRKRFLGPLGLVAGFVDATGGGGWGPVGTPAILASGRMEPRKVIGSIDTSEFIVALAASLGFLFALGSQGINATWVAGLLIGGVIAAPIAAWLVRHVPPRLLGSAVGGIIVFTNTRSLFNAFEVADAVRWPVYAVIVVGWIAAVVHSWRVYRADTESESVEAAAKLEQERRDALVRQLSDSGSVGAGRPQDPRD